MCYNYDVISYNKKEIDFKTVILVVPVFSYYLGDKMALRKLTTPIEELREQYRPLLDSYVCQCLSDGFDRYVVLSYKDDIMLKDAPSQYDVVLAKIVLTYRDKQLKEKVVEYEDPYQIVLRVKYKDNEGIKNKYTFLYLPLTKEYTLNFPNNKVRFNSFEKLNEKFKKFEFVPKYDRDYYLGVS